MWRRRFEELIADLEQNPRVMVTEKIIRPPAQDADIRKAAELAGGILPVGMEAMYREFDGLRLTWSFRNPPPGEQGPSGSINVLPLLLESEESVFGDWKDVIWFDHDASYRNVRPFDYFVAEACAALCPIPGDAEVAYHYLGEELCMTGYTFAEYLELVLQSRGYMYWQMTLCAEKQNSATVLDFKRTMPELFPGQDLSSFAPKR